MDSINIKFIPHTEQRYETCGDWWFDGNTLNIRVSDMGNWKYNCLVALHEMIEVLLCKDRGITTEEVDAFDINFEKNRPEGNTDEPGDDKNAPYRLEHFFATSLERLMAGELKVDWKEYDNAVNQLGNN